MQGIAQPCTTQVCLLIILSPLHQQQQYRRTLKLRSQQARVQLSSSAVGAVEKVALGLETGAFDQKDRALEAGRSLQVLKREREMLGQAVGSCRSCCLQVFKLVPALRCQLLQREEVKRGRSKDYEIADAAPGAMGMSRLRKRRLPHNAPDQSYKDPKPGRPKAWHAVHAPQ